MNYDLFRIACAFVGICVLATLIIGINAWQDSREQIAKQEQLIIDLRKIITEKDAWIGYLEARRCEVHQRNGGDNNVNILDLRGGVTVRSGDGQ